MDGTARMEISSRISSGVIDRRISVAPMMDWTDDL
jgi:tRNA-dihydrouridine synthase